MIDLAFIEDTMEKHGLSDRLDAKKIFRKKALRKGVKRPGKPGKRCKNGWIAADKQCVDRQSTGGGVGGSLGNGRTIAAIPQSEPEKEITWKSKNSKLYVVKTSENESEIRLNKGTSESIVGAARTDIAIAIAKRMEKYLPLVEASRG